MSRWFRHYAGMMRDDKLVRVAIRSGQTIERVVWIYGAILESAAEIDDDGKYDFDAAEAAYFLRASEEDVGLVLDSLRVVGRLSEDHVVKWGDRQFKSDRSADRQARYRERQRAGDAEGEQQNAPSERDRNGKVTSRKRHSDAPETELETETKREKKEAIASCLRAAWPCPDGVEPDHWRDFRRNRKTKRMTDSETAYQGQLRDLEKLSDDEWPPGRLVQFAAEKGWGSICDPRTPRNGQPANNVTSLRGTRPDPALDLLRAARAAEDREADRGTGTTLPAIRTG